MQIRWKDSVVICAISFSLLVLCFAVLDLTTVKWLIPAPFILKLFIITAVIAVLMKLTGNIPVKSLFFGMLIQWADVAIVVFGLGGAIGLFPWIPHILLFVAVVLTVMYLGTFVVFCFVRFYKNKEDSEKINRILKAKQQKERTHQENTDINKQ